MKILELVKFNLKKYSSSTQKNYFRYIRHYIVYLYTIKNINSQEKLKQTTISDVSNYLDQLPIKSASSRNNRISAIKKLYEILNVDIDLSGLYAFRKRSNNSYRIEPVNENELLKILSVVKSPYNIIFMMLFYSGYSQEKIFSLIVQDVNIKEKFLSACVDGWITKRKLKSNDLLFTTTIKMNMYTILNKAVNDLELHYKNITPQSFRMGGMLAKYDTGWNMAQILEWLGGKRYQSSMYRWLRLYR